MAKKKTNKTSTFGGEAGDSGVDGKGLGGRRRPVGVGDRVGRWST